MSTFQSRPKRMSTAQTYLVAHSARSKLTREAGKADHNLRLLVGHANLLDSLMITLAESEREQEAWFNSTVADQAKKQPAPEQHIRWADSIQEESTEDADSESDSDDEDVPAIPQRRVPVAFAHPLYSELDDESDSEDDDEEDLASLVLVRTHSNVALSPPALVHDDSSDSEDDGPASPPQQIFEDFTQKQAKSTPQENFFQEGLFFAPTVQAF